MSHSDEPLPEFARPPLIEVALSVQFEPLPGVGAALLGLLWTEYRDRFPKAEEHPPLAPVTETFGVRPDQQVEIKIEFPSPRLWFLTDAGDQLIQVQRDRFVFNWRKRVQDHEYPRYNHVRDAFVREFSTFRAFLQRERVGELTANQCDLTYVNHLEAGMGWERQGQVHEVVTTWSSLASDQSFTEPEDVRFAVRYLILDQDGHPAGRLHVNSQPAYRVADNKPIIALELTGRGRPLGESIDGVLGFFDLAHEWVVRGFTSMTSRKMHDIWGRRV